VPGTAERSAIPYAYASHNYSVLRPHIVTAGNDGQLSEKGNYGLTPDELRDLVVNELPKKTRDWNKKRVALYAHGGLVPQNSAIKKIAKHREVLLDEEIYPISFIWRSDIWSTIKNILSETLSQRQAQGGIVENIKDLMFDRFDDTLELLARNLGGKALWDEMKDNTRGASEKARGAARLTAKHLMSLYKSKKIDEIHLVGHSAGSILLAPLAEYFSDQQVKVKSLSLWAPACTVDFFNAHYRPLIENNRIETFDLYTLDDVTERDDNCGGIYHKSLLYLVSSAFEKMPRNPSERDGVPLLGLARDINADKQLSSIFRKSNCNWYKAPAANESDARHHGDFDDDDATLQSTLKRILKSAKVRKGLVKH
jgi:pimeloyl-ACP methyl ester carboxylesterase